ncbi:MAG: 1-(5-phosphoribosyl)-5-[(5-phosphoribosylamino)methylideneamino]imidazole-4-carboxamide isomerase [Clostridia bacterium]
MILFPAIDLHHGCAVRLLRGDYTKMTEYSDKPEETAARFAAAGAAYLHIVDLEGAKTGETVNIAAVRNIVRASGLKTQLGGGIRSMEVIRRYLDTGVSRVILGTAALKDPAFLAAAVSEYGAAVAVGVDIQDGKVAVSGWTEISDTDFREFCRRMEGIGVQTIICTDISRDGAMQGTNRALYAELQAEFHMDIVASGGISSLEDIKALANMHLYGAILGKALYTGAVKLEEALRVAEGDSL